MTKVTNILYLGLYYLKKKNIKNALIIKILLINQSISYIKKLEIFFNRKRERENI